MGRVAPDLVRHCEVTLDRPAPPARLPGLDLLRAVAIAWVMVCHAGDFGFLQSEHFGWMGVDLFFALSGYLIAGQLLRPIKSGEAPHYENFFARRLLRTLPVYLVVLGLYFSFPILWDRGALQPAWQFLSFTQNLFIDPQKSNSLSQAWSLCVEEQFYLVLPLILVLIGRRASPRSVVALIAAVLIFGMGLRAYLWLAKVQPTQVLHPGSYAAYAHAYMRYIYYPTWTRLDGLLAGVALALLRTFRPGAWAILGRRANLLLSVGVLGVAGSMALFRNSVTSLWPCIFGHPLLAASMAALVAAGSDSRSLIGRWRVPGAGALAAASYSLYLSHKMAFHAVIRMTAHGTPEMRALTPLLAVGAAVVVGAALHVFVERPFLKLRDRFRGATAPARPPGLQPAE